MNRALAMAMIFAALLMIGLSLPRLWAAVESLPGDEIKAEYYRFVAGERGPLSEDELDRWHASRLAALSSVETAQTWGDIASIHLIRATQEPTPAKRELRTVARVALTQALKLSPADGFRWYHLALIDQALGAQANDVLHSVRASIAVAPYQPSILTGRIMLIFENWDITDEELRQLALEQASHLRLARHAGDYEDLARRFPERIDDLRMAANNHRDSLRAIDRGAGGD